MPVHIPALGSILATESRLQVPPLPQFAGPGPSRTDEARPVTGRRADATRPLRTEAARPAPATPPPPAPPKPPAPSAKPTPSPAVVSRAGSGASTHAAPAATMSLVEAIGGSAVAGVRGGSDGGGGSGHGKGKSGGTVAYAVTITRDGPYVDGAAVLGHGVRLAHLGDGSWPCPLRPRAVGRCGVTRSVLYFEYMFGANCPFRGFALFRANRNPRDARSSVRSAALTILLQGRGPGGRRGTLRSWPWCIRRW